jgi:hypothetical protein
MNVGEQTVEWLYKNQLQVDEQWSVRTERGFTWWPYQHAQTVTSTDEVKGPDGTPGAFVGVRTQVLRDLDLTDQLATGVNELAREGAGTMSGLMYDETTRTLDLCSMVPVHDDTREWMQQVISVAAVLQIGEAQALSSTLMQYYRVGGVEATSAHPANGKRPTPDEMAGITRSLIIPMGTIPCAWTPEEFSEAVDQFMQQPPALLATSGETGFTVEFPFGDVSSLCQADCDTHLVLGNGLRMTQSFPMPESSDGDGARFALHMNATELASRPVGYGFGSYFYRDGLLCFSTFFPNFIHKPGLLRNLYFAAAQRARSLSVILARKEWDEHSFDVGQSAVGRMAWPELDRQETQIADCLGNTADDSQVDARDRQCEQKEQVGRDAGRGRSWYTRLKHTWAKRSSTRLPSELRSIRK